MYGVFFVTILQGSMSMSKISIPLKNLSKTSIDLADKSFDSKLSGDWVANGDKEDLFLQHYIQEKFKHSLHTLPFVYFKIIYDKRLGKTVFLLIDSSKMNIVNLTEQDAESYLKRYRDTRKRFTFCDISIAELNKAGDGVDYHAVSALYDKNTNKVEIFDSIGSDFKYFKKSFKDFFSKIYGPKVKIIYLVDRCVAFGKLEYEKCDKTLYKYNSEGFCAIWVLWFLELRLANPDIPKEKLIEKALKRLKIGKKVCELLRGYAQFVGDIVSRYTLIRTSNNLIIKAKSPSFAKKDYRYLYLILSSLLGSLAAVLFIDKLKKN